MIRSLLLRNAGPFRGEHELRLGPKAYALTAQYETDPGRSNWGGKSFLLEMVEFALTGVLSRPRAADYAARGWGAADGWIHYGEKEAEIRLELEGGGVVSRSRRRGKPTAVTFESAAGKATGLEAQAAILRHVGFDAEDFRNVAYFEQGEMKRIIRTEPEKRFEIVRGWLGLERAEEAEAAAAARASEVTKRLQRARGRRDALRGMLDAVGEIPDVARLIGLRDEMAAQMERASAALERREKHGEAERAVASFDELVELGKRLAEELAAFPADLAKREAELQRELGETAGRYAELDRDVARKKKVALGQFDGRCPVADFICPAQAQINANRSGAAIVLARAEEERDAAEKAYEDTRRPVTALREKLAAFRAKEADLERMRERARELQPEAKAARKVLRANPEPEETAFDLPGLRRIHQETVEAITSAAVKREQKAKVERDLSAAEAEVREAEESLSVSLAARNVFRATQRRVSERALTQIGGRANGMMREAGIDLSVDVRWEREGKNLARACEMCGAAFPASARVKACESCGAERGQNVVQRLEFILSARSGAADDVSGVAMQLAAGEWLLRARSSPWATAMLDEPLAACDKANRRALAGQLIRMLGSGVWRQALVISHSQDVVDLYPGRVEVFVARDGTRSLRQQG